MPEQITKYPDVTIEVLKGAGARCGEGVEQKILKKCPPENFCALPSGEICVYGIEDIPSMTQIRVSDLAPVVCPAVAQDSDSAVNVTLLGALVAGLMIWRAGRRR